MSKTFFNFGFSVLYLRLMKTDSDFKTGGVNKISLLDLLAKNVSRSCLFLGSLLPFSPAPSSRFQASRLDPRNREAMLTSQNREPSSRDSARKKVRTRSQEYQEQ